MPTLFSLKFAPLGAAPLPQAQPPTAYASQRSPAQHNLLEKPFTARQKGVSTYMLPRPRVMKQMLRLPDLVIRPACLAPQSSRYWGNRWDLEQLIRVRSARAYQFRTPAVHTAEHCGTPEAEEDLDLAAPLLLPHRADLYSARKLLAALDPSLCLHLVIRVSGPVQ